MQEIAFSAPNSEMENEALRMPPHSIDAEQSVLGGLMIDNSTWDQVVELITEEDFYRRDHRLIFLAVATLAEEDQPFDPITLKEWLDDHGQLDEAGGLAYLGTLSNHTPTAANIAAYAKIVREKAVLRNLIRVTTDIANSAYQPEGRKSEEILDLAEKQVFDIAESGARSRSGYTGLKTLLTRAVDRIDALYKNPSAYTGIPTGFTDFDGKTSGLQNSDLIIIAGRPSMGKTTFAMNIVENAAIKSGTAVAVFSMEMPGESLVMRMLSSLGRIDQHKIRTGQLDDADWPRLTSALGILSSANIFIDDTASLNPMEIRARARRIKRDHGSLGLIVIDYLQLMQTHGGSENRATEISEISRGLKALAKELNHVGSA